MLLLLLLFQLYSYLQFMIFNWSRVLKKGYFN